MRFLFYLPLLLCCVSCASDSSAEASSGPAPRGVPVPATETTGALAASTLTSYPTEHIQECGCTLKLDPTPENSGSDALFFVFNWQSGPGVISLNGKDYLVQRGASLGTGGKENIYASYLHQSENFRIQTSLTVEGQAENEGKSYSGKVRITQLKTGEKLTVDVVAICSC